MDLKSLNSYELLKLRASIDAQIKENETLKEDSKKVKDKTKLSGLSKEDKIFFVNFKGSKIFDIGYTTINFYKKQEDDYKDYRSYTSGNGCSSCLREDDMNNYCFLDKFTSSFYFYTLKPENWQEDLKAEIEKLIKNNTERHMDEMKGYRENINNFISTNKVGTFLEKIKE